MYEVAIKKFHKAKVKVIDFFEQYLDAKAFYDELNSKRNKLEDPYPNLHINFTEEVLEKYVPRESNKRYSAKVGVCPRTRSRGGLQMNVLPHHRQSSSRANRKPSIHGSKA